jgi:hypothetical protein
MMETLKPVILAGSLMFLMVGLSIAQLQHPEYADMLFPLYLLVQVSFVIVILLLLLGLLVQSIQFAQNALKHR